VMRFGQKKSFQVKLGEPTEVGTTVADNEDDKGTSIRDENTGRSNDRLGISVGPVTSDAVRGANIAPAYRTGVMVTKVSPRGPSYHSDGSGLTQGDIILSRLYPSPKQDIKTADDLQQAVSGVKDVVEFKVYNIPTGQTRAVSIQVGR